MNLRNETEILLLKLSNVMELKHVKTKINIRYTGCIA
jgi:hypothetical protein